MKVAVIGSRNLMVTNLSQLIPPETTEIVSGGARGVDTCAANLAVSRRLKLTEFPPEYEKYGRRAPLIRNIEIIKYSDLVLAFWDGKSGGTKFVIDKCRELGVPVKVFMPKTQQ